MRLTEPLGIQGELDYCAHWNSVRGFERVVLAPTKPAKPARAGGFQMGPGSNRRPEPFEGPPVVFSHEDFNRLHASFFPVGGQRKAT
jgi:hypothetical protein